MSLSDLLIAEKLQQQADRIKKLEAKLISNGICPKCDARIVVDYRAGKATNHRCKERCGWKKSALGDKDDE